MNAYEFTLKQYQELKLQEFKMSKFWHVALKLKKEIRDSIVTDKMTQFQNDWYEQIIEYGKFNKLDNKIIYSFDKEYGRSHLMHCFRGNREGLKGWINSDAIKYINE